MKKHWIKLSVAGLLILSAGVLLTQGKTEQSTDLLITPASGNFVQTVTSTGELQARNSIRIVGPSGAQSAQIYQMQIQNLVPEGTVVQKGDFVAEIDRSEVARRIQDAQIELQRSESQYEQTMLDTLMTLSQARDEQINLRYTMEEALLRKEQAVYEAPSVVRQAEIEYEKAERAHEQAVNNYRTQVRQAIAKMQEVEAGLNKSRKDLADFVELSDQFRIVAPEDGMVIYAREWSGRKITSGSTINAWNPIVAELPDLSQMESKTYINEVDIQKVRTGQPVRIGLDADPDKRLTGTVSQIANIGEQRPNSDARVFEVTIRVHENDTTLRPAMSTSNNITVAQVPDVLRIPLETLHTRDDVTFVFVRTNRGIVRREVRLGLMNDNEVIVEAGLDRDEQVFLSMPSDTSGLRLVRLDALEPSDEEQIARDSAD